MASKILFRNRSDFYRPGYSSSSGSHISPVFKEVVEKGIRMLVVDKYTNVNDYIQASLADSQIYNLLDRYGGLDNYVELNGGVPSVLDDIQDFTVMPKSLAEAQQVAIDARRKFDSMPRQFRAQFDNNVNLFIHELSDGSATDKIKSYFSSLGLWDKDGQYIRKTPQTIAQEDKQKEGNV